VSEPTQKPDQPGQSIDAERLKRQAEQLRQEGYTPAPPLAAGPSRAAQVVYLVLLALIVGAVFFLLISGSSRVGLLRGIAEAWGSIYATEQQAEVYKLPPPPPKAVEPRVVMQGSPTFAYQPPVIGASEGSVAGDEEGAPEGEAPSRLASKPPAPAEKTAGANAAYEFLLKKSDVARRLANNGFPEFRFREWRPLVNAPPEFWVNLIATKAGGQEVNFIWIVNPEAGTVVPKSQEARDIDRK
jgi:hypothetical protein